jgi:RNA polymerase sigma factor (sigma-70 family)
MRKPESHAQLEALIAQYGRLIRTIVCKVAGTRADLLADDIEQKVIVNLWRQLDREQTIQRPASYIYRMSVREAVRAVREHLKLEFHEASDMPAHLDSAAAPAQGFDTSDRAAIEHALRSLQPDRERAVRAHLAGFTVTELMHLYGWSYHTARNLIARGFADLRACLRRQGLHD